MRKNQDFLHNLRKIAFAHQCKIISKCCAMFTQNVKQSLHKQCMIFMQKISLGNPNQNQQVRLSYQLHLLIEVHDYQYQQVLLSYSMLVCVISTDGSTVRGRSIELLKMLSSQLFKERHIRVHIRVVCYKLFRQEVSTCLHIYVYLIFAQNPVQLYLRPFHTWKMLCKFLNKKINFT